MTTTKYEQRASHIDCGSFAGLAVRELGTDADAEIAALKARIKELEAVVAEYEKVAPPIVTDKVREAAQATSYSP